MPNNPAQAGNQGPDAPQLDIHSLTTVADAVGEQIKRAAGLAPLVGSAAPAVAEPLAPAPRPGVERWSVKTGTDDDVGLVGKNEVAGPGSEGIVDTTVEELVQIPRPADMSDVDAIPEGFEKKRSSPVETTIWRIEATIIAIKKEADGDLHMVLQGTSGETMIAEAPTPKPPFVGARSPWLSAMQAVRQRISDRFGATLAELPFRPMDAKFLAPAIQPLGPAATAPAQAQGGPVQTLLSDAPGQDAFEAAQPFKAQVPQTPVTVVGVGFFDRVHGQMGVSQKNGIELHPVLQIDFK